MKIVVVGLGYVGLSMSCLLASCHDVIAVDVDSERVDAINAGTSPIGDPDIASALADGFLKLRATDDIEHASDADYVIIATPTDYDADEGRFDTSSIDTTLEALDDLGVRSRIVIKSTVPVGYTSRMVRRHPELRILFSPEFLREGHALEDNLHPSRIVVGDPGYPEPEDDAAPAFAAILAEAASGEPGDHPVLLMGSSEAEAVKLFANTYLAMRVAFFNEIDTYAETAGLAVRDIIDGVCADPRVGAHYNNPSFGYGGYCLPKDSKQLLANYEGIPQNLISATVGANRTRKDYIAQRVWEFAASRACSDEEPVVGIYRLAMKSGSDNYRHSSMLGIVRRLARMGISMLVYEPLVDGEEVFGVPVAADLVEFKKASTVVIANRLDPALDDILDKVYSRDLFARD